MVERRQRWRRGRRAEALAVLWLRLKGYRILARNFRVPVGEIDVIAGRGRILALVEVKARADLATALAAVAPRQWQRIARAATWFAAADRDWRFDLMVIRPWRRPRHLVDAWRPSAGRPSDGRAV
ncbi:MAG: YraN family protein [Pseudomonadota bacterium]|nr:YraN family protein [Pseudomonadota bacterium]